VFFGRTRYTEQASTNMDISMDIHAKSVDVDMDMDGEFHIHGNPGDTIGCSLSQQQQSQVSTNNLAIGRNVTVTMLRGREVDVHG